MRASSYVIHVELPAEPDRVLLVHGYSGAYDVVARHVADYLRTNQPEQRPSDETIDVLVKRGYLTDLTPEAERERVRSLAETRHAGERQATPHYVFMMTYDCNLRCGYCFQDHMRTDPAYRHLLRAMDRPMIDRWLRAMDEIDALHARASAQRSITVFGGEPLLAANRPVIEYLTERICGPGGSVVVVTNGTELDHYLDLLRPDAIGKIQVTIDGPRDEHDRRRIRADGTGSFDAILDNLVAAAERDVAISLRINTDRINVERLPELARLFIERGLDTRPHFYAYAAPVHAATETVARRDTFTQYALTKRITELRERYPEMAVIQRPADASKQILRRLMRDEIEPWQVLRATHCGAHSSMYVLDPFGDIYACWERTGDPAIRIGTVDADGRVQLIRSPQPVQREKRKLPVIGKPVIAGLDAWRDRTFATNDTCLSCEYAFYCGGGCAAEALDHKQEYFTNYCSGFQHKFRVAAAEVYAELRSQAAVSVDATGGCER